MEHNPQDRKENLLLYEAREIALLDLRARYDHVFYLPIEFPIVLDGLRPDDPGFQADIDRRIRHLLESADVSFRAVTGSVEERQEQVRRTVGAVETPPAAVHR
jgi:hypothetical protein